MTRIPRLERFLKYVQKTETCWWWTGGIDKDGYGDFGWSTEEGSIGAHRASYRLFKGEIPAGLGVLHTCDNRACVNPDHLFLGTGRDNIDDMMAKNRQLKGENANSSKLTDEQAKEILRRYIPPQTKGRPPGCTEELPNSTRALAKEFGVTRRVIQNIVQRKMWKHLNTED